MKFVFGIIMSTQCSGIAMPTQLLQHCCFALLEDSTVYCFAPLFFSMLPIVKDPTRRQWSISQDFSHFFTTFEVSSIFKGQLGFRQEALKTPGRFLMLSVYLQGQGHVHS